MATTGFTGDPIHPGSWNVFGVTLPDLGWTESRTLGGQSPTSTGQGGSDWFKNNPTNIQDPNESWTNPTLNEQYNKDAAYQPGVNSVQTSAAYATANKLKADQLTQKDVQPINQLGGGGNAASQDELINKYRASGWTDMNAILADIANGGASKFNTNPTGGADKTVSRKGDPRASLVLGNPNARDDFEASGMNIDEYLATIDREAGNVNQLYDKEEATLRAQQPGIEQGIRDQAGNLINRAGRVKEDAQAAARRLYSELQQGFRQRFGGASSAGEAAMALTGTEQQRQMAQNNRTYQESVAQIDLSTEEAVRAAQTEFNNQLLEIGRNRTATENQRLEARRGALQDLANKVFEIRQQATAFKQNLALMQEQARLQNEQNLSSLRSNPTSTLGQTPAPVTASGNQGLSNAVGYVNPSGVSRGINLDEYMRNNVNPYAR